MLLQCAHVLKAVKWELLIVDEAHRYVCASFLTRFFFFRGTCRKSEMYVIKLSGFSFLSLYSDSSFMASQMATFVVWSAGCLDGQTLGWLMGWFLGFLVVWMVGGLFEQGRGD